MAMQIIRHLVAMTAAVLLATTSGAPAADADPPLPLAVKQRLTELTEAPSARGQCFDAEAVAAVAGAAPAYADEIALFAGRRVQDRAPRGADDCSCLIELATALGRAVPARAQTLARLIAQPSAACGRLIVRGIDATPGGDGKATGDTRTANNGAPRQDACTATRTCSTPLLRPQRDVIGPTRLGGDS